MSLWNSDKDFRNDYEKKLLPSLDARQLSRDGRMRNPDEKPLVQEPKPAETATAPKTTVKQPKEEPKSTPQAAMPVQKVEKEPADKEPADKGKDAKSVPNKKKDVPEVVDEPDFVVPEKETLVKEPEIDPVKLKEMKREEEMAKAKLALERKKKLAEKNAAKAALKAQREAEKKLKVTIYAIFFSSLSNICALF